MLYGILFFKFQYDSINTGYDRNREIGTFTALNSNMILLIPKAANINGVFKATLNSNMILLILISKHVATAILSPFKFQYDSINTCPRPEGQVEKESLNSNMIY